jgi:hypothetical protein
VLWLRACAVWIVLAVAMVAHGTARERLLRPHIGELAAHQVSCFTGSLLILAVSYVALPWLGVLSEPGLQLRIGGFWFLLTVAFEFLFGHWVAGHPWKRLFEDYNLFRGKLWLLVLGATLLAPRVAGVLHGWRAA